MLDSDERKRNAHRWIFWGSVSIIFLVLILSVVATETVGGLFKTVQQGIVERFGWFYILSMTGFLVFVLWLMLSRFGAIRLGPDDAEPEFSRPTWFAMLFSAGMGIGLLFFSVAEPIKHFSSPPTGAGGTAEAGTNAMGLTFFHWGLHPWAVYSVIALALAYFRFRKGLPLSIRSAFYPLLGDRIYGRLGHAVDILAVVSTLFGVATSLGFGAMQVNAGLAHVSGLSESLGVQVAIIALITVMATVSVVSGLDVGIRRLSELNMGLAGLLLLFVFVAGPTSFLLNGFIDNIGSYLQYLPLRSFRTGAFVGPKQLAWLGSWTIFYWAWWIAWAPFVGMFIARISKGRTIREFLAVVLFGPSLTGFIWFTVFGNTAIHQELHGAGGITEAVSSSLPTAIFVLLERFPLGGVMAIVCTVCVVLFFVTSSDSASLVVDTIASGGSDNPSVKERVFWASLEGVVAAVLLMVGGLTALQTAAITTALPFCAVIVMLCISLVRGLRNDSAILGQ